jgi:hypothetical protein
LSDGAPIRLFEDRIGQQESAEVLKGILTWVVCKEI